MNRMKDISRRGALQILGGAALFVPPAGAAVTLPPLPYAVDALEPHIDARTMEIHHDKHHQAYVDNLNKAIGGDAKLSQRKVEDLLANLDAVPAAIRTAVRNHGGGHANHSLFWKTLGPAKGSAPKGKLAKAIDQSFGSYSALEDKLKATAMSVFGSGWAWLALDKSGRLVLEGYPNQDSPISKGLQPVLGIDVWEHAYYLKYQNRRADYLAALLKVVNWDAVTQQFEGLSR